MQTNWNDCSRCVLFKKRVGQVKGVYNEQGRILLILSEPSNEMSARFLDKAIANASDNKMDSHDLAITEVVGCSFERTNQKNFPFKGMCSIPSVAITTCRERALYLIDKVDPHIIIASGLPAAKIIGIKSGSLTQFNNREIKEVQVKGHLIKIPRMVMVIPTLSWLIKNFTRDPEGPTAHCVNIFRKAIEYSELRQETIGDRYE